VDLRLIRYFVAVAEARSFSGGAKLAFVTQPTLSSGIAALEKELQAQLFDRHPRGARLTPEGERLLEHARAVLREVQALRMPHTEGLGLRRVRVGVLPTVPSWLSARLIDTLQSFNRDLPVVAQEVPLADLRKRLFDGRFDLCLTSLRAPETPFRQHHLFSDRLVLALSTDDSDARKRKITPEMLRDKPLIARTQCEHLFQASRILDSLHVQPRIVLRTNDDAHALDYVAQGVGCCLLPDSFRRDAVVLREVEKINLRRNVGLEWVRGRMDDWLAPKLGSIDALANRHAPVRRATGRKGTGSS
jgi:DNA-binding transcriptional LysR family regulator